MILYISSLQVLANRDVKHQRWQRFQPKGTDHEKPWVGPLSDVPSMEDRAHFWRYTSSERTFVPSSSLSDPEFFSIVLRKFVRDFELLNPVGRNFLITYLAAVSWPRKNICRRQSNNIKQNFDTEMLNYMELVFQKLRKIFKAPKILGHRVGARRVSKFGRGFRPREKL